MKEDIRRFALSLGFDAIGFCRAANETPDFQRYEKTAREKNVVFPWLLKSLEKRRDIRSFFPGAKTVIVVGASYANEETFRETPQGSLRIASYAARNDYHTALSDKLSELLSYLEKTYGAKGRICVDSSPVAEKNWAAQAGLGFQGKNTLLISKDHGAFLLLGILVTDLDIDPDPSFGNPLCGDCTACINACPSKALSGNGTLDVQACISYQTVESKNPPPKNADLGGYFFGCDECLKACPWSKKAKKTSFPWEKKDVFYMVRDLLSITEEEYLKRFEKTPILRLKYRRFREILESICRK